MNVMPAATQPNPCTSLFENHDFKETWHCVEQVAETTFDKLDEAWSATKEWAPEHKTEVAVGCAVTVVTTILVTLTRMCNWYKEISTAQKEMKKFQT